MEENVAKIEVNNEFTIIETIYEESIDNKALKKDETAPVKTQVKKSKKKSKKKSAVKKVSDKKVESNKKSLVVVPVTFNRPW